MEFINFISTVITTRIIEEFRRSNLLNKHTYGEIMEDLTSAWRKDNNINNKPSINDGLWVNTLPSVFETMQNLNMLNESKPKIKRGQKIVTDTLLLNKIILFLSDNIGSNVSFSSIRNVLVSSETLENRTKKGNPSSHTIESNINAIVETHMFYEIKKFDIKG